MSYESFKCQDRFTKLPECAFQGPDIPTQWNRDFPYFPFCQTYAFSFDDPFYLSHRSLLLELNSNHPISKPPPSPLPSPLWGEGWVRGNFCHWDFGHYLALCACPAPY